MSRSLIPERRLARLDRHFEFSRFERQLVATAYELLAPPLRRSVLAADLSSGLATSRSGELPLPRRAQGGS